MDDGGGRFWLAVARGLCADAVELPLSQPLHAGPVHLVELEGLLVGKMTRSGCKIHAD